LQKYFESSNSEQIFINDIIFIDENRAKFDMDEIISELPNDTYLAVPIFD
jgi:hypothetical protein